MHIITIYFVGGCNLVFKECPEETALKLEKWLTDDSKIVFRIDSPETNKTKLIRKDLILFIDVE